MSLIDCPECGQRVSDQADTCPSCGIRISDSFAEVKTAIIRIDLEWERKRREILKEARFAPTKSHASFATISSTIAAILIVAIFHKRFLESLLLAVPILLIGQFLSTYLGQKATDYEKAESEYLQKREDVIAKYKGENESDMLETLS